MISLNLSEKNHVSVVEVNLTMQNWHCAICLPQSCPVGYSPASLGTGLLGSVLLCDCVSREKS